MLKFRLALLSSLFTITVLQQGYGQCGVTDITGDLIISSDQPISGTYNITGLFQVDAGITVTVTPYSSNGCGELVIRAGSINVQGTINADNAGYTGGSGGNGSSTGTGINYLTACDDKDDCYSVMVNGGTQGLFGSGPGAGNSGGAGGNGVGPKQECLNTDDSYGLVGGSGGGGAGGGGSYGANAGTGGSGGGGNASGSFSGMSVSTCASPTPGLAGSGGAAGTVYGTLDFQDIDMGSGGAGAGGGGKSYYDGTGGGAGGTGGGKIILISSTTLIITGTLSAQGSAGANGGTGGAGGKTSRCCGDGCDDCGETTYSAGAGGGGGAGGGAGGGIYVEASGDLTLTGTLRAEGGNGGLGGQGGGGATPCNYNPGFPQNQVCDDNSGATNAGAAGTMGGGGSGGRVKVFQNPCKNNVITANVLLSGGNGNGGAAATGTTYSGNIFGINIPTVTTDAVGITCNGDGDGSATANPASGQAPYAYVWSDVNAQTTQTASGLAPGDYTVTITDDNGCSVTGTASITEPDDITVTAVITNPCSGGTGLIEVTPAGGTPGYTYFWTPNGETTEDLADAAEGTHDLFITDANGCQYTNTYTVTANVLTITAAIQNETCAGLEDGSIALTVTGGSGNYTYLWGGAETDATISGLAAGPYNVTVTDTDNGCTATQTFTVQSGANYVATITQDGDTLTSSPASSYQWYLNNQPIQNATSQTYTILESGTYYCVVNTQNCEFTSNVIEASCICSIPIGINDNSFLQNISVFPNPASQVINVVFDLPVAGTPSVTFIDLTGRKLWTKQEKESGKSFAWKIPVTGLAAGSYFVQVTIAGQTKNVNVLVKE